jgi:hypothetical protein
MSILKPCFHKLTFQLRYPANATQSIAHDWVRVRRLLSAYLYLHVAVHSRDQGVGPKSSLNES